MRHESLTHLRRSHCRDDLQADAAPRKITLRRKSQSELKLASPQGRARTVNVEVRSKRTYVKREVLEDQARVQQEEIDKLRETEEQAKAALERADTSGWRRNAWIASVSRRRAGGVPTRRSASGRPRRMRGALPKCRRVRWPSGSARRPPPSPAKSHVRSSTTSDPVRTPRAAHRRRREFTAQEKEVARRSTLLHEQRKRGLATIAACSLFYTKDVRVKLLPFDNKSEIQVVLDLPHGASLEDADRVLMAAAERLKDLPELVSIQAYAGTAAPFNFNGLVRHYYLRSEPGAGRSLGQPARQGQRDRASHAIALDVRNRLADLAASRPSSLKVVEVPPGPPVLSTLLAEIYGPDAASRRALAAEGAQGVRSRSTSSSTSTTASASRRTACASRSTRRRSNSMASRSKRSTTRSAPWSAG